MVKKGKIYTLYDPIYGVEHAFFRGTWGQWQTMLQTVCPDVAQGVTQEMPNGASGACGGYTYARTKEPAPKRATFYIFVERGADGERQILSHECLHAAIAVMELIGHDAGKLEGSEPLAYYHDWLVKEGIRGLGL